MRGSFLKNSFILSHLEHKRDTWTCFYKNLFSFSIEGFYSYFETMLYMFSADIFAIRIFFLIIFWQDMRNFKYPKIFPKKCFSVIENAQKLSCFESNRALMFVYKRELIAALRSHEIFLYSVIKSAPRLLRKKAHYCLCTFFYNGFWIKVRLYTFSLLCRTLRGEIKFLFHLTSCSNSSNSFM